MSWIALRSAPTARTRAVPAGPGSGGSGSSGCARVAAPCRRSWNRIGGTQRHAISQPVPQPDPSGPPRRTRGRGWCLQTSQCQLCLVSGAVTTEPRATPLPRHSYRHLQAEIPASVAGSRQLITGRDLAFAGRRVPAAKPFVHRASHYLSHQTSQGEAQSATPWLRTGGRKVAEGLFEVRALEGVDDGRSWPLRLLYFCAVLSAAIEPLHSPAVVDRQDACENRQVPTRAVRCTRTSSSVEGDNSKIAVWAWR
jgi:hypothetical protein